MNLTIKNAFLVDRDTAEPGTLHIVNGKIAKEGAPNATVIDAEGKILMPAFVDPHVHFRTPGLEYKEDITTGSAAAAAGGYTAVCLMANTNPVCSNMEVVNLVKKLAAEVGKVDVHQCVSVTQNFDGKTIDHLKELDDTIVCISEDGKGVQSNHVMNQAMLIAKERGMTVLSHTEDMEISPYDYRLAENIATARDIFLSAYTGCPLHLCHVSTKEAMDIIIENKQKGAPITCEVGPHHIYFAGTGYRVNPPIRQQEDVDRLITAIADGWVDCIATDHAPHTDEDKKNGSPGMVGLETAFSVCNTVLVQKHGLNICKLSEMMSCNPAKLLKMNKGLLQEGFDGDVVLVDVGEQYTVDKNKLHSKSKNTPFDGHTLMGKVKMTVKGGKITYIDEKE